MTESRKSILSAVSDWLKLLALVVMVAEAAILAAMQMTPTDHVIYGWYPIFMLGFLVIIVIGIFYDRYLHAKLKPAPPDVIPGVPEFRILHYVSAVNPASDFFNRFYGALSTTFSMKPDLNLQYYSTALDPYSKVVELLSSIPPNHAVTVVPKDLGSKGQALRRIRQTLNENPASRLLFLDQEPPRELLEEFSNTSYVGINNRRVGVMAAYSLYQALEPIGPDRTYIVVSGPGGEDRAQWFQKTIKILDPEASHETIEIADVDRLNTQHRIRWEQQRLFNKYSNHAIGIFTGNDETATSICHQSLDGDFENVRIVGCDATREMRQWVENNHTIAVATIYNDLYTDETIETIIAAMSERVNTPLDPRLFPGKLETDMWDNSRVSKLWEDAA